ncbi:MAG: hypothetical protein U5L96_09745 [Owenweeksia sp.]|nr:hypothetical protein [Owenweeksia sp.]
MKLLLSLLSLILLLSACTTGSPDIASAKQLYHQAEIANVGQVNFSLQELRQRESELEFTR